MKNIDYSIIIPHKNIPSLLQRCLDSIPKKECIQIIVVDDNSDPNSVDFSNFPGLNCEHIEVYFTKEGKGAGYARNVGLNHAKGKWILFVDADDFFVKDFVPFMDKYVNSTFDIVFFDVESRNIETSEITNEGKSFSTFLHSFDYTSKQNLIQLVFNHEVPWGK